MQKHTWPGFMVLVLALSASLTGCGRPASPTWGISAASPAGSGMAPDSFLWSTPDEPYLTKLRMEYGLDKLTADQPDDFARARAVLLWVHGLWRHNGSNEPKANDPISIIEEVRAGKQFRCVEYSIVLAGALNSVGIPARVLSLKTADVETRKVGAGHVVAEAYLADQKRWVFLDGQTGAVAERSGVPLNAVELGRALAEKAPDLTFVGDPELDQKWYIKWVQPYLYYLDVPYDNRVGVPRGPKRALMLVPEGAPEPKVFQRKIPLDYLTYTRSVADFYPVFP